jgi:hypothetical protein
MPLIDRPQVIFHHAMKLDGLAGGDAQGVVAVSGGQFVENGTIVWRSSRRPECGCGSS